MFSVLVRINIECVSCKEDGWRSVVIFSEGAIIQKNLVAETHRMLISVTSLEKDHEVAMLGQYQNFWSRFHNTRASLDLPPLRSDKTVTRNDKDDEDGVDEEEDGVDEEEEQEEKEESDSDRKVSPTESDEGFGDSLSLGFEMEEEEKDKVDIFTKSLDIDNLDLRNFLIVGDRKKKISDISEIIAYNRELRKQVLL